MNEEIIVNCFKNPGKNIDINLESSNFNNKLIVKNNDDIESSEGEDKMNKFYFNCLSKKKLITKYKF